MIQIELVTFALISLLRTNGDVPIGDHDAPRDADGVMAQPPFAIVYKLEGGARTGPAWSGWQDDLRLSYQVTSSGTDRRQAEAVADHVREIVTGRFNGSWRYSFTQPAGAVITSRETQDTTPGVDREGRIFTVPETFYLTVTPT